MSEAKKLTAKEEEWLRRASATGYGALDSEGVARLFATLDAERAKVEALESSRDGWHRQACIEAARATAAEAEAERLREALRDIACFDDYEASKLYDCTGSTARFDEPSSVAKARAALAKEKPDAGK